MPACDAQTVQAFATVLLALLGTVVTLTYLLRRCEERRAHPTRRRRRRRPPA